MFASSHVAVQTFHQKAAYLCSIPTLYFVFIMYCMGRLEMKPFNLSDLH